MVTSINDAKVLISSSKVTDRTNGLKELINILKYNRGKPSLDILGNKAYLSLCETLFQCMRDERAAFLRSKAKSARISAALPLSATALRYIVNTGVRAIKATTVENIIDHIIEVLPGKNGTLLSPLLEDLPKALRSILEYQPHVERLPKDCWDHAVEFCLESLESFFVDTEAEPENSWSTGVTSRAGSRARTPFDAADLNGSLRDTRKHIPEQFVHAAEDFVHCLQSLTKASNAPILPKADHILTTLIQFLQRKGGRSHSAAFAAINSILPRLTLHSAQLTRRTIQDLLPLMKSMWSDPLLRDDILIALMHTEAHLSSILADKHADATSFDLEALVETMYADYRKRQETTVLQFLEDDYLCFRNLGSARGDTHPLNTYAFSLETGHARCESLWATVTAIARFSFMLDHRKRVLAQTREDDDAVSIKRLRITHNYQEYLRLVSEPKSNAKRAALQVVAFMLQEGPLDEEDLQSTLEKLTVYISDENPVHSSWAMIALTAAAFQKSSKHVSLLPSWVSAWQSAARTVTSISSSRAACHFMNVLLELRIVPFSAVSETVQSMLLSIELSGPALLTEASSSLMTTLIKLRIAENPAHFNQTAERVLNWFLSKWTPSFWPERTYSSVNSHHCNASDVLRLLHACLDRPYVPLDPSPFLVLGAISQAKTQILPYRDLGRYLLLLPDEEEFRISPDANPSTDSATTEHLPTQLEIRVLEVCISELEKTRQRWKEWTQQNAQGINADMLRIVTNFCIVASALCGLTDADQRRVQTLESAVASFTQSFVSFLARRETEQYKVDAVIEICTKNLPDIRQLETLSQSTFKQAGVFLMACHLSKALRTRNELKESFHRDDEDFMDVDEAQDSQLVGGAHRPDLDVPRHDIQAAGDPAALRATCSAYCHLVSCLEDCSTDEQNLIPVDFVNYLTTIHEGELLRCRQLVTALLSTRFRLQKSSCRQLLDRLTEGLIDPRAREYNSSEVAHGMVVEVLIGTILNWDAGATDRNGQDLYEDVESLYSYYARHMENKVRRSSNLQRSIADYLHGLLKHHPDFGQKRNSPSVRTILFELLATGEIAVKYHIAERLPRIFEDFILSEHEKILQDVDSSLPSDPEWNEGLAIRLLVLARLASQWHTLIRQGVYRIFATAGSVEDAAQHARRCISNVAKARKLENSQALFRLFAPQIIFTWLDRDRKFSEIPFLTFDYSSLEDLIRDVESEAVGQAIMLGREEEVGYLATVLGTSTSQVLINNFGKAAAYTISWDTCKGSARNKSDPSNAMLLRELIGPEQYGGLILEHFPRVLGYILQTIDQEEKISKPLDKRPAFSATAKALSQMNNISHSEQHFELGIEPSFSTYYLFDQIERLCRRLEGYDPVSFWVPSIYTFVMRMLLDRLHPALGSLHARSIIRKVRILVALAGKVAYEGYPLQMTLQSLRPFLTDIQCAEDTLGVVQYLFEHGAEHLRYNLSFVTGIGLSILISLRVFLGSSQESTTQQSQHTATMNKAQRFHDWLTKYLLQYKPTLVGGSERAKNANADAFKKIITAASKIRTEGNSLKNSEESTLLWQILDDVRCGRKLLNNTSREVALDLLCQNFQPASSTRDDFLEADADIAMFAPQVWESCQRNNVGDGYMLWVARVLGRAFRAYGEVKRKTDQSRPWSAKPLSGKDSLGKTSRDAILQKIDDLFYSDDRTEVSLAESAHRLLIPRVPKDSDYEAEISQKIPEHTALALTLVPPIPAEPETYLQAQTEPLERCVAPTTTKTASVWIRDLTVSLCRVASGDPILGSLSRLLLGIDGMAERMFPYVLHLVLLEEFEGTRNVRKIVSEAAVSWFCDCDATTSSHVGILIQAILYLRSQPVPKEVTRVDRDKWLDVDYLKAAQAAAICGMYRSSLLFAETSSGQPIVKTASRRSSVFIPPPKIPVDLQLQIYKNLDEPDSFYGVDRGASLSSVLDRLDYEANGVKSLFFRGARLDSQIRRSNAIESSDSRGMVKSLITLNMNSVTHSLLANDQFRDLGDDIVDSTLHTARKLGQWDIKAPEGNHGESSTLFKAFQGLHQAPDVLTAQKQLDRQLLSTMNLLSGRDNTSTSMKSHLRTLAALTEADEVLNTHPKHLLDMWDQMKSRERWMRAGEFDDVRLILSCRETLFSVIASNASLQESLRMSPGTVRHMEVEALVQSSIISRKHGALQESLSIVTYLSDIVPQCEAVSLDIEATAQHEVASVLWDQGEAETSIRMRQHLIKHANFDSQTTDISLPVLLAKLGHHLAEARLAKPDTIIADYLQPAIQELKGQAQGAGPGQVFHEFALFCDKQLQSPEAVEDLLRIKTVMERKLQEHQEFAKLAQTDKSKGMRDQYKRSASRALTWYKLDNTEYERLRKAREQFLQQCLENYLLSLTASDEYNNDALRVFALWLEYSDTALANEAVKAHLRKVPSGKFALLMNQLSSRLQAEDTDFQKLLSELVYRICLDHPYHGMYQIFAIQMKVAGSGKEDQVRAKDESAKSRQRAAISIAALFAKDKRAKKNWHLLFQSAELYHALAMVKNAEDNRQGRELTLDRYAESQAIVQKIPSMNVPPATLQIEVRPSCDYSDLPTITGFRSRMSIANGLSAPKVITAIGSDGRPYKQLFKSGNDDLRQDAIMEQVFDQVSRLLKNHTATRLRNLAIRTYKVLPLSTRSGLMEFVQNTIPLHLWVMPAHEKYYPSDWKNDKCRKDIGACQNDQLSTRVKIWQKVADNFHPVLRYFLLERFQDPDEWFEKRLAYTRSTAAISILGHVLGLGDRHCHNILLDEKTGEVVHIDLGVSFEAGRVLPVPEVVPFRLTRDIVDAMGYTKTEGVFRRCCEFTMETLREERESIMTLLNVLRYDPLVNWSVTPTKAKRMQEGGQDMVGADGRAGTVGPGGTPAPSAGGLGGMNMDEGQESNRKKEEQAGEAGRALSVVEKKLSRGLSTVATVNELIQQAGDEKNLAVLYCGWSSYA